MRQRRLLSVARLNTRRSYRPILYLRRWRLPRVVGGRHDDALSPPTRSKRSPASEPAREPAGRGLTGSQGDYTMPLLCWNSIRGTGRFCSVLGRDSGRESEGENETRCPGKNKEPRLLSRFRAAVRHSTIHRVRTVIARFTRGQFD